MSGGTLATSHHTGYPLVDLVLTATFGGANVAGTDYVGCYARALDIDGTADADAPDVNHPFRFVGNFRVGVNSASAAHTMILEDVQTSPLGPVEFFLDNRVNATMNAGWTLKATPKTIVPSA